MMMERVAQPPITPSSRDAERHDFWPGFILALMGLIVALVGTRHLTEVDTTEGTTAWEVQLIRAFSSGGLELVDTAPRPDPAAFDDPAREAAAVEQWERSSQLPARRQFRVNTGAAHPCPT